MLREEFVVGLQKLERLGYTSHGLGSRLYNVDELFQGLEIILKHPFGMMIYLFFKFFVL